MIRNSLTFCFWKSSLLSCLAGSSDVGVAALRAVQLQVIVGEEVLEVLRQVAWRSAASCALVTRSSRRSRGLPEL